MSSPPTPAPAAGEVEQVDATPAVQRPWRCVVHDDPVNLMTYVTYVFRSYFGYPEARARELMMQVHTVGRAVVSTGGREKVEADASAMHGYGLWATIEQDEE